MMLVPKLHGLSLQAWTSIALLAVVLLAVISPQDNLYRGLFFALVMPLVLWSTITRKLHVPNQKTPLLLLLFMLVFLSANSLVIGTGELESNLQHVRWGIQILFLIAAILIATEQWTCHPGLYARILLFGTLIAGLLMLIPFLIEGDLSQRLSGQGMLSHPIEGASILLVLWGLGMTVLTFASRLQWIDNLLLATSGVTVILVCLFSQSRGPILSATILIPFAFFAIGAMTETRSALKTMVIPALLLSAIVVAVTLNAELRAWLFDLLSSRGVSRRPEIWSAVIHHAPSIWLFGSGGATPFAETAAGLALQESSGNAYAHTHNIFLEMLQRGGIVALFPFLGALGHILITLLKNKLSLSMPARLGCCSLLLVLVLINSTDTARPIRDLGPDWIIFWLPLIFLVGVTGRRNPAIEIHETN